MVELIAARIISGSIVYKHLDKRMRIVSMVQRFPDRKSVV